MSRHKKEQRLISDLQDRVRRYLLEEWDPLGIRDMEGFQDEYDSYAPRLTGLLMRNTSLEEVFECLWQIETERMGLDSDGARTRRVAQRLVEQLRPPEPERPA